MYQELQQAIKSIPLAANSSMTQAQKDLFNNDQLLVTFDPILGLAKKAIFKMGERLRYSKPQYGNCI